MQYQDFTKFEFLLTLEKNIVIQRYFSVPNYNPASKNSIDLYVCVTLICAEISENLKAKTLDYMSDNPNLFLDTTRSECKEEYFLLQIKFGDDIFISRIFPAHIYHPKVRYAVDIRPKVKKILSDLTNVLSSRNLTKSYLQYELK
jgi:hypothetical protein